MTTINNFINQYDMKAEEYMNAQNSFYSDKEDESREQLYRQFDFDVDNKKILDAGCGFGKDVIHFHELGAIVYGIDASEKMINLAKNNYPYLINNFSVQNFEKTNFENNFFDVIYSRYALHYAKNLDNVFEEFSRILKTKGYLFFLVAHPLLGFVAKKEKDYHEKEIVEISLYNDTCNIIEPTHTFSEYLSDVLTKEFDIRSIYENRGKENDPREAGFKEIVPDYLLINCRKR